MTSSNMKRSMAYRPPFRFNTSDMTIRIVLTGPESTGKSALTTHLAGVLGLPYAGEYARTHLEQNGPAYDYRLLLDMSRWHISYQQALVPDTVPAALFDTDLINYKIWCEVAYGSCHPEIIEAMESESHHVYLLCYPDIPWEPDPLREHPNDRMMLFDRHRAEIERLGRPYRIITGLGMERYRAAEEAVRVWLPPA